MLHQGVGNDRQSVHVVLEYRSVADDGEGRAAAGAALGGDAPAGGPAAAFEHAGQREVGFGRRRAGRGPAAPAGRAGRRSSPARRRSADRRPGASRAGVVRDRRGASTPVSTNRPPLRYSARPVRPSMSITSMPGRLERLDQRISQPLRELVQRDEAVAGVVAADRRVPPAIAERDAVDHQPVRPDRAERLEQQLEDRRGGQAAALGAGGEHVVEAARARPSGRTGPAAPAPARRAGGAGRRGRRGRAADCPRSTWKPSRQRSRLSSAAEVVEGAGLEHALAGDGEAFGAGEGAAADRIAIAPARAGAGVEQHREDDEIEGGAGARRRIALGQAAARRRRNGASGRGRGWRGRDSPRGSPRR